MAVESEIVSGSPPTDDPRRTRSRLLALMFTDLVGSTSLKADLKTAIYLAMLRRHDDLLREVVAASGGQIQQDTGDGCFATFVTSSDAVRAALMFQRKLEIEPWREGQRPASRVGIHLGEVAETDVRQDGGRKLVGMAIDLAARVMSLATGGQILMTRGAFDDARQFIIAHPDADTLQLRWLAHGPYLLKGASEPQDIFEVGIEGHAPLAPPPDSEKARRSVDAGDEKTLGWRPAVGLPLLNNSTWIIDRKLDEESCSETWLARHAKIKSSFRVFKFCFDVDQLRVLKHEVVLLRLLKEALGNRRDITHVIDWRLDEAPYFVETDYTAAQNLSEWATAQKGLKSVTQSDRLKIVANIASALAAAHGVGVLHKDIKPSNVMMVPDGAWFYPRLTNFALGICFEPNRLQDYNITLTGLSIAGSSHWQHEGTRMYAPPESFANQPATPQADVYALGVLLFQMVVGDLSRPLGQGWDREVADAALRKIIADCVDFDPARRLASATQLAERLTHLADLPPAVAAALSVVEVLPAVAPLPMPAPSVERSPPFAAPAAPCPTSRSPASARLIQVRVVHGGEGVDSAHTLVEGQFLKVGRSSQADVIVRSTQVSRSHCEIGLQSGKVVVRDTNSSSGTFLQGKKVTSATVVPPGEPISIGPAMIHVTMAGQDAPGQLAATLDAWAADAPAAAQPAGMFQTVEASDGQMGTIAPAVKSDIQLTGDLLTIGRDKACDIPLDDLMLSRSHAQLRRQADGWRVADLGSTNGTFVNGQRLKKPLLLRDGDVLKIGPYQFYFKTTHLSPRSLAEGIRIRVRGLIKQVRNASSNQPLRLLDDVSLDIEPGEFIGLLGPSGCGKSTLMDALNGRRPGTQGDVFYNDDNLYSCFESYSTGIGYVPQELIFHDSLPVADALRFTSRLRLSKDVSRAELEANIDRVLNTVGLHERRNTLIRSLSGGQKKRVSVAMELISKPSVLFLDEVTSGLDMATEREMMQLFRELADSGVTIICITHYLESLSQCNRLVCLMRGRLIFYGKPQSLKTHFAIENFAEVYDLGKRKTPEEWEQEFRGSKYFVEPSAEKSPAADDGKKVGGKGIDVDRFRRQVPVLTRRYRQLLTTDRTMPLILIGLAPLIALLLCLLTSGLTYGNLSDASASALDAAKYFQKQNVLGFGAVLTIMFLSLFGAVQEVVKELRVYHHERSVNLMIVPYMISKLLPLAVVGALQSLLIMLVIDQVGHLQAGRALQQFATLFAVSLAGTTLGLAISAWVPEGSADTLAASEAAAATKAVTLMNAVVIPQVLFAGAIVPLTGASKVLARTLISAYWGSSAFIALINPAIPDRFSAARGDTPGYAFCMLVLLAHPVVFTLLFFVGMVRKDGPGAFRRLVRALPRDDRGRLAHDRMIRQLGGLVQVRRGA